MTISPAERRIRASFPIVRFLQAYIPHSLSGWLTTQGVTHVRLDADIRHEHISADGVPCIWIIPQGCPRERVLLYLHGGGFVYGLSPMHIQMVAYLARKMGVHALLVDYRLAPEHPFPAALEDCTTAYRWLLKAGILAQDIVVAGDSAGGNLTLTSVMKLRSTGEPLPAALACLSPVADLSREYGPPGSFKDPLLPLKAVKFYNASYVGHSDPHDPLISPVYGDWAGLPPLLLHAGEDEVLREDAVRVASLAKSAGVEVQLEIYPRMWHVWQLYPQLPQAVQSLDAIAVFLSTHLVAIALHADPI
jgi:epsilon-lactone hydrolase